MEINVELSGVAGCRNKCGQHQQGAGLHHRPVRASRESVAREEKRASTRTGAAWQVGVGRWSP